MGQGQFEDRRGLWRATLVMSAATMLSRLLGLVREQVTAYYFGASQFTDVFIVASRWPGLLRDLLAEGAFSSAFIPLLTGQWQADQQQAKRLWRAIFCWLLLINSLILGVFWFFPRPLILLMAPEYADRPEALDLGLHLLKIMSPVMLLMSLSALMMGTLNILKIFFIPALAPALFNVVNLLLLIFLPQLLVYWGHEAILSLAYGMTLGAFTQLVFQCLALWKAGFFTPVTSMGRWWNPPGLKQLGAQLGSAFLGQILTQGNVVLNTILVTSLGLPGAVSWLNYAFRLFFFPLGVLSVALSNSTSVYFSSLWQRGEKEQALALIEESFYFSWWLCAIPTLVMVVIPQWPVALLFEHGAFTAWDREQTAAALAAYGVGLSGYALMKLLMPLCYALGLHRLTMLTSFLTLAFNALFSWFFLSRWGHWSLALATSLSVTINGLILLRAIIRVTGWSWSSFFPHRWWRLISCSFLASLPLMGLKTLISYENLSWPFQLSALVIAVCISALVLLGLLVWSGDQTTLQWRAKFLGKLKKISS